MTTLSDPRFAGPHHRRPGALALVALALAPAGCLDAGPAPAPTVTCAAPDAMASVRVGGTFRYASPEFALAGTITFAQEGSMVTVTDTTYDTGRDRALTGAAPLQGNRLDVALVPKNGDTNYRAEVSLTFAEGGSRFCLLSFSDTNGDTGGRGSYLGVRTSTPLPEAKKRVGRGCLLAPGGTSLLGDSRGRRR
jgi:hypothetical protein